MIKIAFFSSETLGDLGFLSSWFSNISCSQIWEGFGPSFLFILLFILDLEVRAERERGVVEDGFRVDLGLIWG